MSVIVPIIVLAIILLQVMFFIKNVRRMVEYKDIFKEETTWGIAHNDETGFVSGIFGVGNAIFSSITDSINKYLSNNAGSVIDFSLLKDAVDRHCDSVENDINTLTPVPLYCGLAGTMVGVIIGLGSLLTTGSITALLSSGQGNFGDAANGVNDLLEGVAWAMVASICGIFFTTISSVLFKRYKLEGESGKNTFLAWLQAKLLPELPSDTSDALNKLVKNLNKFNKTFAENTTELRGALTQVNESYRIQGDIINAVHDMDVMKMAKANVRVLSELKECTDKLEAFNRYLDDVRGYTDEIQTFTALFREESNRLHVLEEIKAYFERHKAEIAKDSADVDVALRDAVNTLKEEAVVNSKELKTTLVQQAEDFKKILREEKESFEKINNEIRVQFGNQLNQMPMLEKQLAQIADIPAKLDRLIDRIERSNNDVASRVNATINQTADKLAGSGSNRPVGSAQVAQQLLPDWMKWTIIVSVILIAVACISNTIFNICSKPKASNTLTETVVPAPVEALPEEVPAVNENDVTQQAADSTANKSGVAASGQNNSK